MSSYFHNRPDLNYHLNISELQEGAETLSLSFVILLSTSSEALTQGSSRKTQEDQPLPGMCKRARYRHSNPRAHSGKSVAVFHTLR